MCVQFISREFDYEYFLSADKITDEWIKENFMNYKRQLTCSHSNFRFFQHLLDLNIQLSSLEEREERKLVNEVQQLLL